MKQLLRQLSNYYGPLKKGGGTCKDLFLNLSSNFDENTLKLKLRVCTFSSYSLYNCNLNILWSAAKIIKNCACVQICMDCLYVDMLVFMFILSSVCFVMSVSVYSHRRWRRWFREPSLAAPQRKRSRLC